MKIRNFKIYLNFDKSNKIFNYILISDTNNFANLEIFNILITFYNIYNL